MGLDLWFRDDVQRILAAVGRTADSAGARADPEYLRGFFDALVAVGEGFGLAESQRRGVVAHGVAPDALGPHHTVERRVD